MKSRAENDSLLSQLNTANNLVSEVSIHHFTLLRMKTQDYLRAYDELKARYERKYMECEDSLALEAAKYNEIVKSRIKPLEVQVEEQKARLSAKDKELEHINNKLLYTIKQHKELETTNKTV